MGKSASDKVIFLLLLILLVSCSQPATLPVFGDIPNQTYISSLKCLQQLADQHNIRRILFTTRDNVSVEVSVNSLSEIDIKFQKETWNITSETLPQTINLRDIVHIVVESDFIDNQLALFDYINEFKYITLYNHYKSLLDFVGTSEKNDHTIRKYTLKNHDKSINQTALVLREFSRDAENFLVIYHSGLEKTINKVDLKVDMVANAWYIGEEQISIIWKNPPKGVSTLIQDINRTELPLLLILVDGLGYFMHSNASTHASEHWEENGRFFIKMAEGRLTTRNIEPLRIVFPPKTRNAMVALGSDSPRRELFTNIQTEKGVIITDSIVPYTSKFPIRQHRSGGGVDERIFETAKKYVNDNYDFIFVHFHSIDDVAHEHGPYSKMTRDQINIVEDYIEQLMNLRPVNTIIFSDHGLSAVKNHGEHGKNRIEEMVGVIKKINK
jgi:hypothetical protein